MFKGVVGQAIQFDVLDTNEDTALLRVPTVDAESFIDCLVASVLSIDPRSVGLSTRGPNTTGSVTIVARSQYLTGVTAPDRFNWVAT